MGCTPLGVCPLEVCVHWTGTQWQGSHARAQKGMCPCPCVSVLPCRQVNKNGRAIVKLHACRLAELCRYGNQSHRFL
jgi:hypothetical protein